MRELAWTTAFQRDYRKASPLLAERALEESRRLVQAMQARPDQWVREYKTFHSVEPEDLREVRLTSGDRMFVHVGDDAITYFRMGHHDKLSDKPPRAVRSELSNAIDSAEPLPEHWRTRGNFSFLPSAAGQRDSWASPDDVSEEWAHYLSDEQAEVGYSIFSDLVEGGAEWNSSHYLLGGPGTGKTTILLWLLVHLGEEQGYDIRLQLSDPVARFASAATGWDLTRQLQPIGPDERVDVLLVDDPANIAVLGRCDALQREGRVGHVIVAIDPMQLDHAVSDAEFETLVAEYEATAHWLSDCYRQKSAVGAAAKQVIDTVAESSPFLRNDKKDQFSRDRVDLTRRCNQVNFVNDGGTVETYKREAASNWQQYAAWLRNLQRDGFLWTFWPPVLVAFDPNISDLDRWLSAIPSVESMVVSINDIDAVKGLEFQHVAVIIGEQLHRSIEEGFSGSGQAAYDRYRLLRIPFTRARDSLAVFLE